ncbi:MAG: hypothetical protein FJX25_02330 [Alphaproteobacteria bacterium]|nr:hypothetical protein [Alphaproteobacteria bacterium]
MCQSCSSSGVGRVILRPPSARAPASAEADVLGHPTRHPTRHPSRQPTRHPSRHPTRHPSRQPSRQPTRQPTRHPSRHPSRQPSRQPFPHRKLHRSVAWRSGCGRDGHQVARPQNDARPVPRTMPENAGPSDHPAWRRTAPKVRRPGHCCPRRSAGPAARHRRGSCREWTATWSSHRCRG